MNTSTLKMKIQGSKELGICPRKYREQSAVSRWERIKTLPRRSGDIAFYQQGEIIHGEHRAGVFVSFPNPSCQSQESRRGLSSTETNKQTNK